VGKICEGLFLLFAGRGAVAAAGGAGERKLIALKGVIPNEAQRSEESDGEQLLKTLPSHWCEK